MWDQSMEEFPQRKTPLLKTEGRFALAAGALVLYVGIRLDVANNGSLSAGVDPWVRSIIRLDAGLIHTGSELVTLLGGLPVLVLVVLASIVLCVRAGRLQDAVFIPAAFVVCEVLVQAAKELAGRARPDDAMALNSFPSGHAANSLFVWGLLFFVAIQWPLRRVDRPQWTDARPWLATMAVAIPVGMTRIVLDHHWFTDVMAGWALGLTLLMVALYIRNLMRRSTASVEARGASSDNPLPP